MPTSGYVQGTNRRLLLNTFFLSPTPPPTTTKKTKFSALRIIRNTKKSEFAFSAKYIQNRCSKKVLKKQNGHKRGVIVVIFFSKMRCSAVKQLFLFQKAFSMKKNFKAFLNPLLFTIDVSKRSLVDEMASKGGGVVLIQFFWQIQNF